MAIFKTSEYFFRKSRIVNPRFLQILTEIHEINARKTQPASFYDRCTSVGGGCPLHLRSMNSLSEALEWEKAYAADFIAARRNTNFKTQCRNRRARFSYIR